MVIETPAQLHDHLLRIAQDIHADFLSVDDFQDIDASTVRARARAAAPLCTDEELASLVEMVDEQLYGLGPLEPVLRDPSITEVMVNGPGRVWVERNGTVTPTDVVLDAGDVRLVIDRIIGPLGLRLDRLVPFADARLADGTRVHVAIAPMALDGPYLTLRRFPAEPVPLTAFGAADVVELLGLVARGRLNTVVSGGTGAGKTSLLNALGAELADGERIVTIEDTAELRLPGPHVVRMEARPANAEGLGEITIRTLVRNALRMRPDRLVVGEVRGAESFDMVQAMNTGHEGCLTTCHANTPADALGRLTSMALMADVALPASMVLDQIRSALDVVVQVERVADGSRRVSHVVMIDGTDTNHPDRALVADGTLTAAGQAWVGAHNV